MNLLKKTLLRFKPIRFITIFSVSWGLIVVLVLRSFLFGTWEYPVLAGVSFFCAVWLFLVSSCTMNIRCGDMLLTKESPRKIKRVFTGFNLFWRWDPEFLNQDFYRNLDETIKPEVGQIIS